MKNFQFNQEYYNTLLLKTKDETFPIEQVNFLNGNDFGELENLWQFHINADSIFELHRTGEKVIVTTGFGLTGTPHVGTLIQLIKMKKLQEAGIPIQIVLGDLDAYNGKGTDIDVVKKLSTRFQTFIQNLEIDIHNNCILRNQYDSVDVLREAYLIGTYITDEIFEQAKEDVHEYYHQEGKISEKITYPIKLSLNLMVADFLSLYNLNKYKGVLVMLGIDEYKYARLAMHVLEHIQSKSFGQYNDMKLAGIFSEIIPGIDGAPKMGKSLGNYSITADMSKKEIFDMLMKDQYSERKQIEDSMVLLILKHLGLYTDDFIEQAKNAYVKNDEWEKVLEILAKDIFNLFSAWRES